MEKLKGKLEGKIVLNGASREVRPRFDPMAQRLAETNLLRLANSAAGRSGDFQFGGEPGRFGSGFGARGGASNRLAGVVRRGGDDSEGPSNSVRSAAGPGPRGGFRGRPARAPKRLTAPCNGRRPLRSCAQDD